MAGNVTPLYNLSGWACIFINTLTLELNKSIMYANCLNEGVFENEFWNIL